MSIVQLLVEGGADTEAKENSGLTALRMATKIKHWPIVQLLEKHNVSRKRISLLYSHPLHPVPPPPAALSPFHTGFI
jgi:hypothetical protein